MARHHTAVNEPTTSQLLQQRIAAAVVTHETGCVVEQLCRNVLDALLEASPDLVIITDPAGVVQQANGGLAALLGSPHEAIIGQDIVQLFADPEHASSFFAQARSQPVDGVELSLCAADGQALACSWHLRPVHRGRRLRGVVAVGHDLRQVRFSQQLMAANAELARLNAELEQANRLLAEASITDELTGLYNRRCLFQWLRTEMERARRYDRPLSCIMLDLDNFKQFNDFWGHEAGDHVLRQVGQILLQGLRGSDLAFRYGGDEFLILCVETTAQQATAVARKLRQKVRQHDFGPRFGNTRILLSAGVAQLDLHSQLPDDFLQRADAALFHAKRQGRNRVYLLGASPPLECRSSS